MYMTGRTHDLAAFTALTVVMTSYPLPEMTLATALVAFSANMIGGLAPDIDQPTAALWQRTRGGNIIGRIIKPFLGGHRYISHSLLGIFLFGFVLQLILNAMSSFLIVDMDVVWWAFMIGFVSHLIMDSFTTEGVPWLFPIPIKFGIPPLRALRIKTSGVVEKSFVFPTLLLINAYLIYAYYQKFLDFIHHLKR
jgi:inner membrane protein